MDIAKLGITITQEGADEAKAKLDALTASGAKAEQQFTSSSQKISQAMTNQATIAKQAFSEQGRSAQVIETQLNTLVQVTANLTSADKVAADVARGLANALREQAAAGNLTALQMQKLATAEATLAGQAEQTAAAQTAASAGAQLHGLQLGRLNAELGTFIGRLTGTNTAVTRLTAQVGGAVLGYTSMIAILAGVSVGLDLIKTAYDKLTENTRKAREEQEKLLAVLDKIAERRTTTDVTTTQGAIAAGQARLAELQQQLANAQAFATSTAARGYAGGGLSVSYGPSADEALKNVNDLKAKVASAEAELTDLVRKGAADRDRAITDDLANLVRAGTATAAQVENAKALLTGYEQSLTALQNAGSSDTATLVDLTDKIKTLNDALYPKQHVTAGAGETGPTVEQKAVLDGLLKQLDAMRKVDDENHREDAAARAAAEAVGIQGAQLDILNAKRKAELDTLKAFQDYSGPALTDRLNQIQATKEQDIATANIKQRFDDAKAAEKLWTDAQKEANEIAKRNIETTQKQDAATAESIRKQQKYADDLAGIWRDGIDRIATDGTRSFERMAEDVLKLFSRLLDRMRQEGQSSPLFSLATAGLSSGVVGYQFGQQAGSLGNGVIGGAAAGAYQGFQVAGPAGALIGGLTGAATGLLAAAQAHREAAQQLKDAAKQIEQGLTQYAGGSSVQQALNANQSQFLALQTAIVNALRAGVKNSPTNPSGAFQTADQQLQQLEKERAANAQRIADDFWLGITEQMNALKGPAGAFQNQLIELDKKFRDNIESARALGATDDQLRQIEQLQDAEEQQLRAAEAERLAQLQQSLDAREAYARGLTDEGKAIERRAQEEKELFDAQQQGYTDAQIAQLKYIQSLEDAAAAAAKATAIQRQQEDLSVRALRAQGQNAQADALAFQLQQAREMEDAIKAGTDPVTLALLANTQQLEAVAFAAQQLQAAIQQNVSDVKRDAQVLGLSVTDALSREQQAFGFGGLSIDQIKALYTPFTGTQLTQDQETLNNNIAQFLQDYASAQGGPASLNTNPNVRTDTGGTSATANAARNLTEYTGNRMADYLASINVHVASLDKGLVGGNGLSSVPSSAPLSASGLTSADIDKLVLGIQGATSQSASKPSVEINVTVERFASEDLDLYLVKAKREIAKAVEEVMAEQYSDAQIRSGSTLKIGA